MAFGFNRRLLNFLMSGWFFDDKKNKTKNKINNHTNGNNNSEQKNDDTEGNVYETKMDYVSKVTGFLEDGVREMRKDIKKL